MSVVGDSQLPTIIDSSSSIEKRCSQIGDVVTTHTRKRLPCKRFLDVITDSPQLKRNRSAENVKRRERRKSKVTIITKAPQPKRNRSAEKEKRRERKVGGDFKSLPTKSPQLKRNRSAENDERIEEKSNKIETQATIERRLLYNARKRMK
jgi:hypothetical protein